MAFPNEYVVQVQCKGRYVKCVFSGRDTVRGTTCYLDLSAVSLLPRFLPDAEREREKPEASLKKQQHLRLAPAHSGVPNLKCVP